MSGLNKWIVSGRDGRIREHLANGDEMENVLSEFSVKDLAGFWKALQIVDKVISADDRRFLARLSARDFLGLLLVSLLKMVIPSSLLSRELGSIRERFFLTLLRLMEATQEVLKVKITSRLAALIRMLPENADEKSLAPYICVAEKSHENRWAIRYSEPEHVSSGGVEISSTYNDNQFAIKKIVFTSRDIDSCLKELRGVTVLMKLRHPNIIQYYGAWIDFEEYQVESPFSGDWSSELNLCELYETGDSFLGPKLVPLRRSKSCPEIVSVTAAIKSENSSVDSNSLSLEEKSGTICQTRYVPQLAHNQGFFCLYFRIETSPLTLKDWLSDRNLLTQRGNDRFSIINRRQNEEMLRQLIEAMQYIHRQNVIHRNIQPSNIFLKGAMPHVLIGGFDVACYANEHVDFESWATLLSLRKRCTAMDATLYAAPELLEIHDYDCTVDIFSIGIIVMEFFCPYRTPEERIKSIDHLRKGHIPDDFYMRWPLFASIAAQAVDKQPSRRPSADDILSTGLFYSGSEEIMRMKDEISALEMERYTMLSKLENCRCSRGRS